MITPSGYIRSFLYEIGVYAQVISAVDDRNTDYSFLLVAVFDVVNACENVVSLLSLLWNKCNCIILKVPTSSRYISRNGSLQLCSSQTHTVTRDAVHCTPTARPPPPVVHNVK